MMRMKGICAFWALLVLAGAGCGSEAPARKPEAQQTRDQPAQHVILMIGDGMELAHEIAYSRYATGEDQALVWHQFPYRTYGTHWDINVYDRWATRAGASRFDPDAPESANPSYGYDVSRGGARTYDGSWTPPDKRYLLSAATDSAAAATALATGTKTQSGNVSWRAGDPADGELAGIGELLRQQRGAPFGVVSSVQFTHATPAAFASHNTARGNYREIGDEILRETQPDVVIGAGHLDFSKKGSHEINPEDLRALREQIPPLDRYTFVERREGADGNAALLRATALAIGDDKKLFGLFGGAHGKFEHPVPRDRPGEPAFDLPTDEDPSLATATRAALLALESRSAGKSFFLMVEGGDIDWANHANDYRYMIGAMHQFHEAVREVVAFVDADDNALNWENTLLIVTSDHANSCMRLDSKLGKGDLPEQVADKGSWRYPGGDVSYGSRGHTNEPVMIYARGSAAELFKRWEGAWYPGTRLVDNTQINAVMMQALGLKRPVREKKMAPTQGAGGMK